ncbi:hypothetical protein PWT90_07764 [Aphanocladium album]|nr:hypothetical protein PWT90_07764 [Aphanocladium album]
MQLLVARGADVRAADYKLGWEPLHMAAINGQEMASSFLLKEGADCKAPDRTGWTPLPLAEIKGRGVQMRNNVDGNVIQLDNLFGTEIHLAAMNGPKTIAKLLLRPNSTTKMRADNAPTPL